MTAPRRRIGSRADRRRNPVSKESPRSQSQRIPERLCMASATRSKTSSPRTLVSAWAQPLQLAVVPRKFARKPGERDDASSAGSKLRSVLRYQREGPDVIVVSGRCSIAVASLDVDRRPQRTVQVVDGPVESVRRVDYQFDGHTNLGRA